MLKSKKAITFPVFIIIGLLFLASPLFAEGGTENCGMASVDKNNLSEEQLNKIDDLWDRFDKDIIPLKQKLNLLRTEAYNYTLNENIDVEKIKDFQREIRDTQGEINDKHLDVVAEINNILPEDQHEDFSNYFSLCGNKNNMMDNHSMMNGECMMKETNEMDESGMMKMCMQMMDKMHGEGSGIMDKMHSEGGMMGGNMMHDGMMQKNKTNEMNESEHEQHHK